MTRDCQGELFEEFSKKEPRLKHLARSILPRRRSRIVQMSLEKVGILAIFVILGFIMFFALGVEIGKKQKGGETNRKILSVSKETSVEPLSKGADTDIPEETSVEATGDFEAAKKPYTIQVISYSDKKKAMDKVKELEANGKQASIIQSKQWFQVCSGAYKNKEDAAYDLEQFSKKYKGCFLRNREE